MGVLVMAVGFNTRREILRIAQDDKVQREMSRTSAFIWPSDANHLPAEAPSLAAS
jgi:hypothetical protein